MPVDSVNQAENDPQVAEDNPAPRNEAADRAREREEAQVQRERASQQVDLNA